MKNKDKFFEGQLTNFFEGHINLYIGDKDFVFADNTTSYIGEIKTVSENGLFTGKKVAKKQVREYVANQGLIDNFGRKNQSLVMEYHKYLDDPYVIVVPLIYKNNVTDVKQYLDYDNARMLYVHKGNQLGLWFAGDKSQGMKPRRKLICV